MSVFYQIEEIICRDPGQRGIRQLRIDNQLEPAAAALLEVPAAVLTSGFYIPGANACETDGPPGTWALGNALVQHGVSVTYLTDRYCWPVFAGAGMVPLCDNPSQLPAVLSTAALIAIERPGRARDGRYYNMRAGDIGTWTAPLDELFLRTPDRVGARVTVGIGDGGNEIGMGKVCSRVADAVAHGATIASIVSTDYLVVAGTSNWGAWGLTAALSVLAGRNLLPTPEEAYDQLSRCVAAGAVDGITGRAEPTVDSLPWMETVGVLKELHDCLRPCQNSS